MAAGAGRISCICLTGPTATGKTDLALEIAGELPLEIVSMDSALVYRDMDIGTAKPSIAIREQIPHFLIDILDAAEAYSAGRFVADASREVRAIADRGKIPLLVGGTHLYLRALRDGLADLPKADPGIRRRLDDEAAAVGWPALHLRLAEHDPDAAGRISPSDGQRIQRALEVHEITGVALSVLQKQSAPVHDLDITTIAIVPPDRASLADRIERRFDAMLAAGFVEEVERLRSRGDLDAATPSMRAVGYRQIWAHLEGDCDWETARSKVLAATRQLAKRQLTSLRSDTTAIRFTMGEPGLGARLIARVQSARGRPA